MLNKQNQNKIEFNFFTSRTPTLLIQKGMCVQGVPGSKPRPDEVSFFVPVIILVVGGRQGVKVNLKYYED